MEGSGNLENPQKRGVWWTWTTWLIAVAVLLLLYGLSIGPVLRYGITRGGNSKFVVLVYLPLNQTGKLAVVGKPLAAYVNLWLPTSFQASYIRDRGVVFDVPPSPEK